MAPTYLLLLAIIITLAAPAMAELESIYDVLKNHALPMGLLPKGVTNFTMDESGRFEVRLNGPCNAKFENEFHYETNVSGTISYGQIGALQGISAQELFLSFPVKGIRVDIPSSGIIYFDVGVIYKQFSLSQFETPPDCLASSESGGLREGEDFARVVDESKSVKLRYIVDNEIPSEEAVL